jgi:oxalate---CoA ligase
MLQESRLSTVKDLIFNANQASNRNAIESPGYQPLTYNDLRQQVLYVVKTLNAMGFCRNDRIAVISPAGPETAVIIISVMAGFTAVPLNPQNKKHEYERYFSQLKIKAVIVQSGCESAVVWVAKSRNIPIIELIPVPGKAGQFELKSSLSRNMQEPQFANSSDISHVFMTSGTTSKPKIVPISQKQYSFSQRRTCETLKITQSDRCLHIVPYYHGMGIGPPLLSVLFAGGTVICTKEFIPSDFPSLLKTFRPTFYSAGPALHQGILREIKKVPPHELKNNSLRFIRSGSAALLPTVRQELEELLGVPIIEAYAMSEAGLVSINIPQKHGSVGIPVIDSLKIINENGSSLGPYEQGEIVVKGETVFSGYEDAPDENVAAFIDGWFKTGDMGYLDDGGYLFYTGRKKELINKGGEKISPAEIDTVLMTHPMVKEAMTFRINDPVLGEDIAAMVVLENPGVGEEDLRKYLIDRMIQFKVPKRIYFVDDIPKGPTGKLLRYVGTDRYKDGKFEDEKAFGLINDTVSNELSMIQERITQIWKDILDLEVLSPDDDFFRCGGNSLAAIELLIKIQREFQLNFPPDTIYLYPTIRKQSLLIAQKSGDFIAYHPLVVPIRSKGTLSPLFCFHPIDGWIGQYQTISPFLDQNRPLFGIRSRGLEPGEKIPQTFEEAAREYFDAIKTVQKKGPYYLLGFSSGAVSAFALSCILQSQGEKVTYLGIIDASAPSPQKRFSNLIKGHGLNNMLVFGYHFIKNRLKTDKDNILYSQFVKGVSAFSQVLLSYKASNFLSSSTPEADINFDHSRAGWISTLPKHQQLLVWTHRRAMSTYQYSKFSGDIMLFSTGLDSEFFPSDSTRGWKAFNTGKTMVFDIPGDHETLFDEPFGHVVAQKIEESLKLVNADG